MAGTTIVDSGFLVALLRRRDSLHAWARSQATEHPPPWLTCEAVLSETFHILGPSGNSALIALLRRGGLSVSLDFSREQEAIFTLMRKYSDVPMSLADACLVHMTEMLADPVILSTDADFRVYRRHGRQVVPCILPANP